MIDQLETDVFWIIAIDKFQSNFVYSETDSEFIKKSLE